MTNDQSCSCFSPGGLRQLPKEQCHPESLVCLHRFLGDDGVSVLPQTCSDRQAGKCVGEGFKNHSPPRKAITKEMPLCKLFTAVRSRRVKYFWLNSITEGCKRSLLEACSGF